MSDSDNSELDQAVLDGDVILESPNVPKTRRTFEGNLRALFPNLIIHDVNTLPRNYTSGNKVTLEKIIPDEQYLDKVSKKGLQANFANVHIYRTISEIINLENCTFRFDNLRIIGIYKYGKMNENFCHYIEERQTENKIEINLNLVDHFPSQNTTYLFFGAIKLKTVNCETIPYISVKFFQDLPDPEKCEIFFHSQKKYRPREFDSVVSFDITCDQSTLGFYETVVETNDNTFGDFVNSVILNKIESDEELYYETEPLMDMDIN